MSNLANKTIELTDEEIVALASLGLLNETPTGYHLAKDALGFIVNTPDTGSGGASAFTDLTDKASADLPTINTPLANALGAKYDVSNPAGYITAAELPSSLTVYATTAASPIGGYSRLVTSMEDTDYNDTAVDVGTGAIAGSNQLIASLATDAGIVIGTLGILNITTVGNIRKTAGGPATSGTFYFEVYKRNSGGTETLVGTSGITDEVNEVTYVEFLTTALFNDGVFTATDRIVLKFYGSKVGTGTDPQFDFQFGGLSPVRTSLPVPTASLLGNYFNKTIDDTDDITEGATNKFANPTVYQIVVEKNEVSGYPGLEVTPNGELKLFQNGLGSPQPQYQIDRIHRRDLPPTVDDDETQGYLEEDFYIVKNGIQRGIWVCLGTTAGLANWRKLNISTWWDVIVGASAKGTPVAVTGGSVVEHTYEGVALYRFIPSPSDPTLDNFYATFDGVDVSDLVIKRVP